MNTQTTLFRAAALSLLLTVVVIGLQIVFSRWWLARYAYGPAEWAWRWATYGVKPALKRG